MMNTLIFIGLLAFAIISIYRRNKAIEEALRKAPHKPLELDVEAEQEAYVSAYQPLEIPMTEIDPNYDFTGSMSSITSSKDIEGEHKEVFIRDSNQTEPIDFDIKKAIIYSVILEPKYKQL